MFIKHDQKSTFAPFKKSFELFIPFMLFDSLSFRIRKEELKFLTFQRNLNFKHSTSYPRNSIIISSYLVIIFHICMQTWMNNKSEAYQVLLSTTIKNIIYQFQLFSSHKFMMHTKNSQPTNWVENFKTRFIIVSLAHTHTHIIIYCIINFVVIFVRRRGKDEGGVSGRAVEWFAHTHINSERSIMIFTACWFNFTKICMY